MDIEDIKKQILEMDEEKLFDLYEFIDDLILSRALMVQKKNPHFEDSFFVNDSEYKENISL